MTLLGVSVRLFKCNTPQVLLMGGMFWCHLWQLLVCLDVTIFGNLVGAFHQVAKNGNFFTCQKLPTFAMSMPLPFLAT